MNIRITSTDTLQAVGLFAALRWGTSRNYRKNSGATEQFGMFFYLSI